MSEHRVISSDSHVVEPADLWTDRIEPKYRDRAPHIVTDEDGSAWWYCDGVKVGGLATAIQPGIRFEDPEKIRQTGSYDEMLPGAFIPEAHVKDMDLDGVDAGVLFPTVGFQMYNMIRDSNLLASCYRTYNDWVAEFCNACPDRLKGIALLNIDDVQVGIKEMERCAKMGFIGAMIPAYPLEGRLYRSPEYETLWATAQDLEMPLHFHVTTNRPGPANERQNTDGFSLSFIANQDHWVRMSLSDLIFTGVFELYPKLMVGAVEYELSWVPYFLQQIDYSYVQRPIKNLSYRFKEDMLPTDYFHRNVFVGFQEDALGIQLRHIIGVDNLMWGSDYPHTESTFPRSREILEEILSECTEEEKAKIVGGNAARIYQIN